MSVSDVFNSVYSFFYTYGWALEVIFIVLGALALAYGERLVFKRLCPKLEAKKKVWEVAILKAIHKPFFLLIWFIAFVLVIKIVVSYAPIESHVFIPVEHITKIGVVFICVWFFMQLVKEIENILVIHREGHRKLNKTSVRGIGQILRIVVFASALFIILQSVFGIGASGIVAFAGGGGITIGWAAKDMLSNFFGGLMIFLDRPFAIGDRITLSEKNIDGFVENIGWRCTRIRDFSKVPLYVPNSLFLTITVQNPSRMSHRRIKTDIGIRYEDEAKMPLIVKDVREMISSMESIDKKQTLLVHFTNFGESSLQFMVYCFTKSVDYTTFVVTQEQMYYNILKIIKSHGAEIAFPTQKIHFEEKNLTQA